MSSDKMEQQQEEETKRIMDEWQDAAMDIASDDDDDNNNDNNNQNNREHDNDLFPTEIIEASGSNEMSEGSRTSSGMGSFVDVSNAVGNGDQGNIGDELVDVMSEEGSQNTDPSLVLVDRVGVLEEDDDDEEEEEEEKEGEEDDTEEKDEQEKEGVSSINNEIVVQKDEDDTSGHETMLGDRVVPNEEVLSTPIRSNKVSESRNVDLSLEEKISSTEIKDELVYDDTSKDTPLLMEENTKSQYEPNGDELNGQVEEKIESQDDHSSYMPGKSPRSQNYRMKHIQLRQKYVSSVKSTVEKNNDNSSLFQSPSNLTSASQVTTVHRNTAIPSVNSNSSERSDMSTFGKEDIRSPPSSEIFLEEMERRRLRQIALEAVASSTAVNESHEAAKTVKEDRPYESGIKTEFDPYAPVNVHSSSSVPEMEMSETVVSSTSKGKNIFYWIK